MGILPVRATRLESRLRCAAVAMVALVAACDPAPAAPPARALPPAEGSAGIAREPTPAATGSSVPALPPPGVALPPPPRPPGAYANIDPADDEVPGPPDVLPGCEQALASAGVRYRPSSLPVHREKRLVCGAPQVVVYVRGPGGIAYEPTPMLTCPMALALASFERILQEEATRTFGSPVVRITQLGTYNCREMAAYPGWVSEHAYANAIDLARFTLGNGTAVEVERDFDRGDDAPAKRGGAFLRAVSRRAFDEEVFSHVLTPFFDRAHKNHFHLDLARYRGDGTRPEG